LKLFQLDISNFRSHSEATLRPEAGVNLIYGRNGSGKTNLLEAIHYACLTKSFLATTDSDALRFGTDSFEVTALMRNNASNESTVRVYYSAAEGKHVFINRSPLEQFSRIVGEFPCVSLSPYDIALTQGAPQDRRKFLDLSISQTNKAYLADLLSYKRLLAQRNKLLSEIKFRHSGNSELEVWTLSLAKVAASIIFERLRFSAQFSVYLKEAYRRFRSFDETPLLSYSTELLLEPETPSKIWLVEKIVDKFGEIRSEELRRGQTLLGPHRDDLEFLINTVPMKKYASQGQHKTFVICLKLAQHSYIGELLGETPIFLLDDVFSELDPDRTGELVELLKTHGFGQTFITTTETKNFTGINQIDVKTTSRQ
jgi:DNA replication and repair protein RecF